jgi:hypothetical protein
MGIPLREWQELIEVESGWLGNRGSCRPSDKKVAAARRGEYIAPLTSH